MAAVRRNILTDARARDDFIRGVTLLKQEQLGPTTADLGVPGPPVPVSTYDLFVVWHHRAMSVFTPPPRRPQRRAPRAGLPALAPVHAHPAGTATAAGSG